MRVGDYVRTPKGIAKIIDKLDNERFSYPGAWVTDTYLEIYDDTEYIYDEDIIKSSPNIIDLVEFEDILKIKDMLGNISKVEVDENFELLSGKVIGIITHEQMKQMEYKVGDE